MECDISKIFKPRIVPANLKTNNPIPLKLPKGVFLKYALYIKQLLERKKVLRSRPAMERDISKIFKPRIIPANLKTNNPVPFKLPKGVFLKYALYIKQLLEKKKSYDLDRPWNVILVVTGLWEMSHM